MRTKKPLRLLVILSILLVSAIASADPIRDTASANGFKVSNQVVNAIRQAANRYNIDELELTAIGIVETGLGKYSATNMNRNGTVDEGIFQINSVNKPACIEYNLQSPEGSAMCAAKLLSKIKSRHHDYVGRYHSKTPSKKMKYIQKISKVLETKTDK